MQQLLNDESKVPDWRPCHHQGHHGGWNACCSSGVNKDPQTKTEGCKKESSEPDANLMESPCKFQAEEIVSNIQAPEYLEGLSSTIASVMEGLGNSFLFFVRSL